MENEYLYKLGVDASDLDAAISATVSIIGELDAALGSRMPRATASFVGGLEKVRTGITGVATDAARMKTAVIEGAAALEQGTKAARDQTAANQALIQSYREAAVAGTSSAVGTSNQRNTALLNTQSVTGIGNRAAQQQYDEDQAAKGLAAMRAYYGQEEQLHQGMQDAIYASAQAAERRRIALEENQAAAIARATEEGTKAKIAAEQEATAAVEAAVQKRAGLMSAEVERMRAVDAQLAAGNRYGLADGANLGVGTTNLRNTAALNTSPVTGVGSRAAQADYAGQSSNANLAAMAAYYNAQAKTAAGVDATNKQIQAQATNNLPRLRYALYDVSMAFGIAGTALTSVGGLVAKTSTQYQQLFAAVERTSSLKSPAALNQLKEDLIGVTTELPATFEDVTKIATLGNQLNIPAADLVNFTTVVTQFSAETNVSVDAAATAFGRLGQILKTNDYRTLGDEIAYLGVKAVATEADIIKVAQQIAVTTTAYGLSEKQTLALSTAYASLGIKAESARGTTSRAFSDISTAVASGGTKLEEIARVSGVSSEDFQKQWGEDANGALTKFLTGLGKAGSNSKSILAELGITAQRDVTNLALLATNISVLDAANKNAGNSAGFMDKAYQAVANTVQSQLTIAGNKVQAIFNDIGKSGSGPVAGLVHGLNDVLTILDEIAKNPLAASGLGLEVGIITVTGAVLLGLAALAAFKANLLAIGTAVDQLGLKNASLGTIFRTVVLNQQVQVKATQGQIAALEELALAEEMAGAAGEQLAAKQLALAAAQGRVTVANAAAGTSALTVAGESAAATLARVSAAGAGASGALGSAGLLGVLTGPVGLVATLGLLVVPLLPSVIAGIETWSDKMTGAALSTDQLTASLKGLAAAHHEEAEQQAKDSLSNALVRPDTEFNSNAVTGAKAYYNYKTTGKYVTGFDPGGDQQNFGARAGTEIQTYDQTLAGFAQSKDYTDLANGLALYRDTLKGAGLSQKQLDSLLTQTAAALHLTKGATLEQAIATAKAGDASDGAKAKQQSYTDSLTDYLSQAFDASNKTSAVEKALSSLGKAYVDTGAEAAGGSSDMQSAIKAIVDQAGSAPKAAAELETLYQTLVKLGLATPAQLTQLDALIASYGGSADAAGAAVPGLSALADGYNKAADAAAKSATSSDAAAKAQRTLMDYGSDLSKAFSDMDSYQFGVGDSSDKVVSSWQKIKDDASAARDSIRGIRADLQALQATKSQDQYDVKIAKLYGDSIGEQKARADLSKTNDSIADKQKDLKKAQDASSTSLNGNSAAAITNRAALEGQIQNYQGYITALAQSGASQKDIQKAVSASRAEFVKHATQLGFNKKDVDKLADSFTGMGKIIHAIPRNITTKVTANTSAADKAIADYRSSLKAMQREAAKPVHVPAPKITPTDAPKKLGESVVNDIASGIKTQAAKNAAQMGMQDSTATGYTGPKSTGYAYSGQKGDFGNTAPTDFWSGLWNMLTFGNSSKDPSRFGFADGGFTGNGGKYDVAGLVHAQEFVLNQRGAQMLPMADLLAMNQGRAPQSLSPTIVVGGGGSKGGLSTADRMFLAQVLAAKPAIQLSASQFGKAIDHANVVAGMRGGG